MADQEAKWGDEFEDVRFNDQAKVEPLPRPPFDMINEAFAALMSEALQIKDEELAKKLGALTQMVYFKGTIYKHMQPYGLIITMLEIQQVIPEIKKNFALQAVVPCQNQLMTNCVLLAFDIIRGREAKDRSDNNGESDNGGPNDGGWEDRGLGLPDSVFIRTEKSMF